MKNFNQPSQTFYIHENYVNGSIHSDMDSNNRSDVDHLSYGAIRKKLCRNCKLKEPHLWSCCPFIECRYCHTYGHIASNCPYRTEKARQRSALFWLNRMKTQETIKEVSDSVKNSVDRLSQEPSFKHEESLDSTLTENSLKELSTAVKELSNILDIRKESKVTNKSVTHNFFYLVIILIITIVSILAYHFIFTKNEIMKQLSYGVTVLIGVAAIFAIVEIIYWACYKLHITGGKRRVILVLFTIASVSVLITSLNFKQAVVNNVNDYAHAQVININEGYQKLEKKIEDMINKQKQESDIIDQAVGVFDSGMASLTGIGQVLSGRYAVGTRNVVVGAKGLYNSFKGVFSSKTSEVEQADNNLYNLYNNSEIIDIELTPQNNINKQPDEKVNKPEKIFEKPTLKSSDKIYNLNPNQFDKIKDTDDLLKAQVKGNSGVRVIDFLLDSGISKEEIQQMTRTDIKKAMYSKGVL